MINVAISGAAGRMGKALLDSLKDFDDMRLAAAVDVKEGYTDVDELTGCDVVVSFTSATAEVANAEKYAEKCGAVVIGTTGLSDDDIKYLKNVYREVPVVISSNFSIGVNLVNKMLELIASLPDNYDVGIMEAHHTGKKDAPSGTLNMLLETVERARDVKRVVYDRHAEPVHSQGDVDVSAFRLGTIPGIHTAYIAGPDEVIELKHTAFSRNIFASGALTAARWVVGKEPRFYSMQDVLGF